MDQANEVNRMFISYMALLVIPGKEQICLTLTELWVRTTTVYTRVQVKRVYKSNPIFEAKNTTFLEKV